MWHVVVCLCGVVCKTQTTFDQLLQEGFETYLRRMLWVPCVCCMSDVAM